jgi:predicted dithiol-disulfide oxidoreductase (DUF899 family)
MQDAMRNEFAVPAVVDRSAFQAELDALRVREKAHTREGDAIAAARRHPNAPARTFATNRATAWPYSSGESSCRK